MTFDQRVVRHPADRRNVILNMTATTRPPIHEPADSHASYDPTVSDPGADQPYNTPLFSSPIFEPRHNAPRSLAGLSTFCRNLYDPSRPPLVAALCAALLTTLAALGAVVSDHDHTPKVAATPTAASTPRSSSALSFDLAKACAHDDTGIQVGVGTGPVVGLVGDSLSSQLRTRFLEQPDLRAVVATHCGAHLHTPLDDGSIDQLLADQPQILVIALGTNTISDHFTPAPRLLLDRLGDLDRLIAATNDVPCRVWVNVAAVDRHANPPDGPMFIALAKVFNDRLARRVATAPGRNAIADWDAVVASHPDALMPDGIHLTPDGQTARLQLIRDRIHATCTTS